VKPTKGWGRRLPILLPDMALLDPNLTSAAPSRHRRHRIDAHGGHAIRGLHQQIKKNPLSGHARPRKSPFAPCSPPTSMKPFAQTAATAKPARPWLLGALLRRPGRRPTTVAAVHGTGYPLGGHFHMSPWACPTHWYCPGDRLSTLSRRSTVCRTAPHWSKNLKAGQRRLPDRAN